MLAAQANPGNAECYLIHEPTPDAYRRDTMPEFVRVASASEVPPGEMKIVEVNDKEVVIANIDGKIVCFSNECTHRQGPMGEGVL